MLCITGLPMIFLSEIDHAVNARPAYADLPAGAPSADIDTIAAAAKRQVPDGTILYLDWSPTMPLYYVTVNEGRSSHHRELVFDRRTGQYLEDSKSNRDSAVGKIVVFITRLHIQLLAGVAGEIFLGLMGLCFLLALGSGVIIYGPYMKKLSFGAIRGAKGQRLRALDTHNLFGIVTLGWLGVVVATGTMNTIGQPLYQNWRQSVVPTLVAPVKNDVGGDEKIGLQKAVDIALTALPQAHTVRVIPPGTSAGNAANYIIWTFGDTPITQRLFRPVLVNATSGQVTLAAPAPWYIRVVQVSMPLHFGSYGGLPLKILWALFDIAAIIVLATGVALWLSRWRRERGI